MRNIASTLLIATGLSIALVQVSLAADLPQRPVYKPPVIVAPALTWTGCYVGANIGGAFSNVQIQAVNNSQGTVSPNNSGFTGGGQIGCDYQMGPWVVGFRDMFDGLSMKSSATLSGAAFTGTANTSLSWFDTLTVRGGYLLQPNLLLYGQGGAAWTQCKVNFVNTAGVSAGSIGNNSNTGWTAGAGLEWMFTPHWSAFLEYDYMGFGTRSAAFTVCPPAGCGLISAKADLQTVLVGVNYKF